MWRPNGRCKVVAVHIEPHGYASMDLGAFRTVDMLGDVVVRADALRVEAPQKRLDGSDFALYPLTRIEREFNVRFVEEESAENGNREEWDDDFESSETRPWTYRERGRTRFVRAATW